jgi:hypothetical protein
MRQPVYNVRYISGTNYILTVNHNITLLGYNNAPFNGVITEFDLFC